MYHSKIDALEYMANKMPSTQRGSPNPIKTLSIEDIDYLIAYLEKIKAEKINLIKPENNKPNFYKRDIRVNQPDQNNMQKIFKKSDYDYFNPYEYGAKQNILQPLDPRNNYNYQNSSEMLNRMGLNQNSYQQKFPGQVRNVDLESCLQQREQTHLPGQREITDKEINRFNLLPFNPQDHNHIVWNDNMPRGGYSTRNDRLEIQ